MTRVELYEAIRRGYFIEEKSKRELAREYGVHRRDVRRAIASSTPQARKLAERASPVPGQACAACGQPPRSRAQATARTQDFLYPPERSGAWSEIRGTRSVSQSAGFVGGIELKTQACPGRVAL
jgi:hypothetical protein